MTLEKRCCQHTNAFLKYRSGKRLSILADFNFSLKCDSELVMPVKKKPSPSTEFPLVSNMNQSMDGKSGSRS